MLNAKQRSVMIPRYPGTLATYMPLAQQSEDPAAPNALDLSSENNSEETISMKTFILNSLARLHKDEAGQGLVEYLLILALVALAATAGMSTLASKLNSAFTEIGAILGNYIS
jgi:pilus assembly protein Flp/PilA